MARGALWCYGGNAGRRATGLAARDNWGMTVPDEEIDDFIARWRSAFNETLSREEAQQRARELIELYKLLLRPKRKGEADDAPPASTAC